jgi:uncharacterized membrane protein YagU involved in acid resistance
MTASAHPLIGERGTAGLGRRVVAGVVGGIAGGLVFGILMAMMGMLPMVAGLVRSDLPAVGFAVHIVISILIGLGLTVLFGNLLLTGYWRGLIVGLGYGAVWWVLGGLILMPLGLGMQPFMFDANAFFSLIGHLLYGVVLGVVAVGILSRRR